MGIDVQMHISDPGNYSKNVLLVGFCSCCGWHPGVCTLG